MQTLVPLVLLVPLGGAAAVSAFKHLYSPALDAVALAIALAVAGMCAALLYASADDAIVYWFGGWEPVDGIPIGIEFVVEPLGAAFALLTSVMVVAALLFSIRYFEEAGPLFHSLVLVFLGSMAGFALTADLFNLFVLFELTSVAAFALTSYRSSAAGPLQGAFAFAVTNTIGAILVLTGIALVYGRTNALNFEQAAEALAGGPVDGLVVVSFALLVVGFLVKAAAVPFHFWLADAYSVAPAPVAVLFSAVMSDIGLYAIAEVYWSVYEPVLGSDGGIRAVLLGVGTATAVVGAVMALLQRNLKRLLAFATISHIGLFLLGVALLTIAGLAGTAVYLLADGLVKGGLFLLVGLLVHRHGSGDELHLHRRGRGHWITAAAFTAGGLALAAVPPFGTFLGKSLIEESAHALGLGWVAWTLAFAELVTGAAVLRAAARIFGGLGPSSDPLLSTHEEEPEEHEPEQEEAPFPRLMTGVAGGLVAAGLAAAFVPGLPDAVFGAAERFVERPVPGSGRDTPSHDTSLRSYLFGAGSTLGAVALAALLLWRERLVPDPVRERAAAVLRPPLDLLRAAHSGHVGDYVAWLTAGLAAVGGALAIVLGR